jgi:hypothetical protein
MIAIRALAEAGESNSLADLRRRAVRAEIARVAPPAANETGFAEQVLAVVEEGRRTATYKVAVVHPLLDATAEGVDPTGGAPSALHRLQVGRRVARLYLRQRRGVPRRYVDSTVVRAFFTPVIVLIRRHSHQAGQGSNAMTRGRAGTNHPDLRGIRRGCG